MRLTFGWLFVCSIFTAGLSAQKVDCITLDVNKVPGQWIWDKRGGGDKPIAATQWQYCEPIRKELQRIMPTALEGLHATNSIAFGEQPAFWYTNGPYSYENYLMLKNYECLKGYNQLKPNAVTGCWAYFVVNNYQGEKFPLPSQGDAIKFYASESTIIVTNIEIQTDAAGNKFIYTSYRPEETVKHCYYFSARKDFPLRKITNRELFTSYKVHHEKRVNEQIAKFEKLVSDDQQKFNSLSPAEKKEQAYWPDIIKKNKEYLQGYKNEMGKISAWYTSAMKQGNIDAIAYVSSVNAYNFYPDKLEASAGNGYNAWVDNPGFFDKTLPRDQPQCIALYIRRQDDHTPKKKFMDLFYSQFNLDVLARMVGEPAKKQTGINSLNSSFSDTKAATGSQQDSKGPVSLDFANTAEGQFPVGWNGMKNIKVQSFSSTKWLAMTKDGYWYPQQYNKEIKNNFSLSFGLRWNEDIAYNSGSFTVTIGEIGYDNASERYRLDDNQPMYWSLYNGYVGNFNRVVLWFDPYWNSGGTLTIYSYDNRENLKFSKRITLPDFYKEKNNHQLKIQRSGNGLIVTDNGKTIADLTDVFLPVVRYNIYTFSRYKGEFSDNKNDVFYLNTIDVVY